MSRQNTSKWAGPLAAGLGALLIIVALFVKRDDKISAPLPEPVASRAIEVSGFQVDGMVQNALNENPSLKAEEDSLRAEVTKGVIEQEILVRQALAQDLGVRDTIVRNRLTELMVMSIYQQADAMLSEEKVKEYYEKNTNKYMAPEKRLTLSLVIPVTNRVPSEQARAMLENLYAQTLDALAQGGGPLLPVKPAWYSLSELRLRYGPTMAERVFDMPVNQWSEPVETSSGWQRVIVLDVQTEQPRPFEQAKQEVTEDLRRELRRMVYDQEMERMKKQYEIVYVE